VEKLIREGNGEIKIQFEELLQGKHLHVPVDEQIVYNQLDVNENAICVKFSLRSLHFLQLLDKI